MTSCAIWVSVIVSQVVADSTPDEKQVVRLLQPHYQAQAASYQFALDQGDPRPLQFVSSPVMRWTSDGNSGAVWVWTFHGRPEVIGCIGAFINGAGKLEGFHEFHSLTIKPLPRIDIRNVRTWASAKPGVELRRLENAEPPAADRKLRLVQMRNLARQFHAEMKTDNQSHVLRLSSTPLFRYTDTNDDVLDGAIFSYLWDNGTDPEFLLMLEARPITARAANPGTDEPSHEWWYAPVRFTWRELLLKRADETVWSAARHDESRRSQTLVDSYVTVPIGELDLKSISLGQEAAK